MSAASSPSEPAGTSSSIGDLPATTGSTAPVITRSEATWRGERLFDAILDSPSGVVITDDEHDATWRRVATPDGRIQLAGPVLFSGYRGQPELSLAALDGPWFVTSDLGSLDGSGRLTVRGRADGMINTGGEKVAADEVAAVLAGCPGVRDVAVTGRADPEWGELVTAVVVPADPADPPTLTELRAAAAGKLPGFAAPRAIVLVPAIPLLRSGKPDLQALRQLAAGN